MSARKILEDAKALIVERGWHQGWFTGPTGCLCMAGAMNVADGGEPYECGSSMAFNRAWAALERAIDDAGIPGFNDALGRTLAEVLAKFDEAISAAV